MEKILDRKRYLLKNTALFTLGNIGSRFITFLLVPLYTNVLTPVQYGEVDLIVTLATVLVPILTLNFGEAVMRFSLDKGGKDNLSIMKNGWIAMAISIVIALILMPLLYLYNGFSVSPIIIMLYCLSQGFSVIAICNLRGKEKLLDFSLINILQTFLIAVLNILFLVVLKHGIEGYFTSYIIANIIVTLISFYRGEAYTALRFGKMDNRLFREMVKYSMFLIPTSLMWWIMNSSDRVMVSSMVGVKANGIYAISYKIPSILSSFSIIFNQAWSYSAIRESESDDSEAYSNSIYRKMFVTLTLLTGLFLATIKPLLSVYVSKSYFEAWQYTPYLLIGFMFLTLATFLSTSYTVHKDSRGFLISGMVGAILNVILNWALIPQVGVAGAAFATGISYFLVFIFRGIHTRKYLVIKLFDKKGLISTAILIVMSITLFYFDKIQGILLAVEFAALLFVYKKEVITGLKQTKKLVSKIISRKK